jgi:hypothetical protein
MTEYDAHIPRTAPIQSATFSNAVNAEIRRAAATGIYDIRGGGAKRRVPHFDDLLFLGASVSRAIRWKATARPAARMSSSARVSRRTPSRSTSRSPSPA